MEESDGTTESVGTVKMRNPGLSDIQLAQMHTIVDELPDIISIELGSINHDMHQIDIKDTKHKIISLLCSHWLECFSEWRN